MTPGEKYVEEVVEENLSAKKKGKRSKSAKIKPSLNLKDLEPAEFAKKMKQMQKEIVEKREKEAKEKEDKLKALMITEKKEAEKNKKLEEK